jgi:hypothetical protein
MAQAFSHRPVTAEVRVRARVSTCEICGQQSGNGRFFGFFLSISFHCGSPYPYTTCKMNNRHVGGRSSETSSHPIDINNIRGGQGPL